MKILGNFQPYVYALTRIVVGLLFALHGAQKLLGWFGGMPEGASDLVIYGAGTIELVGGVLVAMGLFTRWAAFVCSGAMAVAYFMAHQPMGLLPIENRGESAALYSWIFLLIATSGDGIWALSSRLRKRIPAL